MFFSVYTVQDVCLYTPKLFNFVIFSFLTKVKGYFNNRVCTLFSRPCSTFFHSAPLYLHLFILIGLTTPFDWMCFNQHKKWISVLNLNMVDWFGFCKFKPIIVIIQCVCVCVLKCGCVLSYSSSLTAAPRPHLRSLSASSSRLPSNYRFKECVYFYMIQVVVQNFNSCL